MILPPWPDAASPAGKIFFANAHALRDGWLAIPVSSDFAIGMVANEEAEASLDPNELGDYVDAEGHRLPWMPVYPDGAIPTSFGLHQRKRARCNAILARFGYDIAADAIAGRNTLAHEIESAWWELQNFPVFGLAAIQAATTPADAARAACVGFERASAPFAAERRAAIAERWQGYFAAL